MRLSQHRMVLLLLLGLLSVITLTIAAGVEDKDAFIVKNFKVSDIPADDGSGLVLSWTPLPKERRIIEYRIYRGVEPNQLFFLSSIPVNVKTGVASETMYYYDSAPDEFIDIKSPGKLKKEKQQGENSPIYRNPPRDMKLLAKLAKHYSLLAVMDKGHYYYRTKKSFSADPADSTAYAGLDLYQMTIRAGLKTSEKYYYSVLAVDEKSVFHPHAGITEGSPQENPPAPAQSFYGVYLQDKQKLQFEWEYPLYKDDLVQYQIMMLPNISDEEWNAKKLLPGLGGLPAVPIAGGSTGLTYLASFFYDTIDMAELAPMGITPEKLNNARFSIALYDAAGLPAYSNLSSIRFADSSQLPPKPQFKVLDKPNDKGDRLAVIWSNPVILITKVSFTNAKNDKMKINYMLNASETQHVRSVDFDFYRKGEDKPFKTISEFYIDNIITLKVPEGYDIKAGLRVVMRMVCSPSIDKDYQLEQNLEWNDQILTLNPGKLHYKGINLFNLQNVVYQKPPSSSIFYQAKKMSSYDSNVEITIPYESQLYRPIQYVNIVEGDSLKTFGGENVFSRKLTAQDKKRNLVLVDANIDLMVDPVTDKLIRTSLYSVEGKKDAATKLKEAQDKLTSLKAQEAVLITQSAASPEAAQVLAKIKAQIEDLDKTIKMLDNKVLAKVNSISSDNARMHLIAKTREKDKRRATFYMLRSDGKGMFVASDEQKDKNDKYIYTAPIANWFDMNKLTALIASLIFGGMVFFFVRKARKGHDLYIRPIAGIHEIDNAIGRATEMGRPILYIMGSGSLSDIPIIASLGILSQVARKAAEYDTRLIVPCYDYIVMPVAQEVVREAHYEAGRPDSYDKNNVFYLTQVQFAYVAGVNGIMIREKVATNFFLGFFAAEALLMTETGNAIGAIQIAGSDAVTQIPFFITTCDYTLIGEELYAASAYLNREPMLLGTLKAQDYYKFLILSCIIVGAVLSTFQLTSFIRIFPMK
jgi:hypothetical protein